MNEKSTKHAMHNEKDFGLPVFDLRLSRLVGGVVGMSRLLLLPSILSQVCPSIHTR